MGSDDYKAEKVYKLDPKTGEENVNIPNSALFNNPIAQTIYANYLYKNVKRADGSNYFNGSVYDIIGECQAHNDASKLLGLALFMPGATIQNIPFISSGVQTVKGLFDSSYAVDLGPNIDSEDRPLVRVISKIYKWKRAILGL